MRRSIQRAIMFVWIQALLGRFPPWNTAPKVEVNCTATAYGQG
jgi:hypothetical protein